MKLRTFLSLARSGRLSALWRLSRAAPAYHRIAFLASGLESGWLRRLAAGPVSLDTLAAELGVGPAMRDGLESWLRAGVALGELRSGPGGYVMHGKLARTLADPDHDDAAAFVEEMARLHHALVAETPQRIRDGRPFTLDDQDARLVARSSRLSEPFILEALEAVVPQRGTFRLLEIGCGAATYIRFAALRDPELTATGLELQEGAAALARDNVAAWGLADRVAIEVGDVRKRRASPAYDLATLHQNIYYFPVQERVALLEHVRGFLKPGGRLLLTTLCRGRGAAVAVLDLWGAMTEGCGRLPEWREMVGQIEEVGFVGVTAKSLIPGEGFYAFVGTNAGSASAAPPDG